MKEKLERELQALASWSQEERRFAEDIAFLDPTGAKLHRTQADGYDLMHARLTELLADMNTPMVINVRRRSGDYMACLEERPEVWGCGHSPKEALGDLITAHGDVFAERGLKVVHL